MSIIGDKIHRIRDFRGMTQKQLGMAVGFDEKSADVRIAQYESGTRTPKQPLVEKLAEALDVNPNFLSGEDILCAEGVIFTLFELDERFSIEIVDHQTADGITRKAINYNSQLIDSFLREWQQRKKDLADGKISKAEYMEWKLNWPDTADDCGKHLPSKQWRDNPTATEDTE